MGGGSSCPLPGGIVLHQSSGEVRHLEVHSMRPVDVDPRARTAIFSSARTREYVELSLLDGRALSRGRLPPGQFLDGDYQRRRIASYSWSDRMLRVFQMP